MTKYKRKMNREQATTFVRLLEDQFPGIDYRDIGSKMHQALLVNVISDLRRKLSDPFKKEVSVCWPAAEALAVQLFILEYMSIRPAGVYDYLEVLLLRLSGEIDRLYG